MKQIGLEEAEAHWRRGAQIIDVRSASEFRSGHVPGARNVPLEDIETRLGDLDLTKPVLLICQAGQRAAMAAHRLAQHDVTANVVEGGTKSWRAVGLPIVISSRTGWALERQVRLAAGMLALAAVVLGFAVSRNWFYLAGMVGLGLTVAGLTDVCPMSRLLGAMPWNGVGRRSPNTRQTPGSGYAAEPRAKLVEE